MARQRVRVDLLRHNRAARLARTPRIAHKPRRAGEGLRAPARAAERRHHRGVLALLALRRRRLDLRVQLPLPGGAFRMNVQANTTRGPTRRQIVLGWTATALPIGAWMVHLTGEAALVRLACEHRNVEWYMHALTAGTALICLACLAIGVTYARRPAAEPGN